MKSGYIAIVGVPNVGKSTFLNQVLKEKISIVTDKPQTTRNKILGILHWKDGQMVFLDTPGFHSRREKLNQYMLSVVRETMHDADLIIFMSDPQGREEDRRLWQEVVKSGKHCLYVVNKIDRIPPGQIPLHMESHRVEHNLKEAFAISAKENLGMEALLDRVYELLPEGIFYYPNDQLTDQPLRFIVAELIREKITELTYKELPYSVAVEIEEFQEPPEPELVRIKADVIISRSSQKKIIIGRKGEMLKKIGTLARRDIEKMMGRKIYLGLFVKVEEGWIDDDGALRRLGYAHP